MIPKYGLEGTLFLKDDPSSGVVFSFDEEEPSQTCGGFKLRLFQRLRVQLSLDQSNVQHEKLVLKLVEPRIPGFSVEPSTEAANGDDKEAEQVVEKTSPKRAAPEAPQNGTADSGNKKKRRRKK